jgi:hypothetical protein
VTPPGPPKPYADGPKTAALAFEYDSEREEAEISLLAQPQAQESVLVIVKWAPGVDCCTWLPLAAA